MPLVLTFDQPLGIYCPDLRQRYLIAIGFARAFGLRPPSLSEFIAQRIAAFPADALEVE